MTKQLNVMGITMSNHIEIHCESQNSVDIIRLTETEGNILKNDLEILLDILENSKDYKNE